MIVQVVEHAGFLLKFGLKDLCMECIQIQNNGELIQLFFILFTLVGAAFFVPQKLKNT